MSGSLNLKRSSPLSLFDEILTVAEVEHFLGLASISPSDPQRDASLETFIVGARAQAEIFQGRDLVEKQYELTLDYFPCEIELRDPLVSVDSVQYRNYLGAWTVLTPDTDYIVDTAKHPGVVMPPYGKTWPSSTPWPTSSVLIRFTSGMAAGDVFWSDSGQFVLIGMKQLISDWYTERLPYATGSDAARDYSHRLTALLTAGAVSRVR